MQRDFTYIDDVVEALVRLIDLPPAKEAGAGGAASAPHTPYNIGNHTPITLTHFIGVLEAVLGREAAKRYCRRSQATSSLRIPMSDD
jgi:UDP-glucuronate 4-epimerase